MRPQEVTRVAVLVAIGIVLPSLFHLSGISGRVFLPMHIVPLLGGFLLERGAVAFLTGFILPPVNFLLTGMPPFPSFVVMMFELGAYGFFVFFFSRRMRLGILSSLILSMLCGRAVSLLGNWMLFAFLGRGFNAVAFAQGLFVTALPGIALQLLVVPLVVHALLRRERNVTRQSSRLF
jgi:hypothetical protein